MPFFVISFFFLPSRKIGRKKKRKDSKKGKRLLYILSLRYNRQKWVKKNIGQEIVCLFKMRFDVNIFYPLYV